MSGTRGSGANQPIVVGLAAIAVALVGMAGYLLVRPHRRHVFAVETPVSADDSDTPPVAAPPVPSPPAPPLPAASPAIAAAPSPPEALPQAPAASAPEPAAPGAQHAAVKKRALLMADHNQRVILEADEQAFDALQLPDATRAAIRQINASHGKSTRDFLEASTAAWSPGEQLGANIAKSDESDRARRAALKETLGAEGVAAFETAEYAAARRLRRRYATGWAQDLEQQAPLPEGMPPSPH